MKIPCAFSLLVWLLATFHSSVIQITVAYINVIDIVLLLYYYYGIAILHLVNLFTSLYALCYTNTPSHF